MYGKTGNDGQYHDGLLPYHLKDISNTRYDDGTQRIIKWLVLDAPVDTLWIESLNTLLDDTRMLSLLSGFRINLKKDIKIVFEPESLTQATPATISRVDLVYFESERFTWYPVARKWLDEHKSNKDWYDNIAKWFDKYVYPMMEELEEMNMKYLVKMNEIQLIINLIKIFNAFIDEFEDINPYNKLNDNMNKNNQDNVNIMNQTGTL